MDLDKSLETLCALFKLIGTDLTIEDIRTAGENTGAADTIQRFWNVIHFLLSCEEKHDTQETQDGALNLVQCVQTKMFGYGYKRWKFFCLPDDFSSSSQELLLALAWLLGDQWLDTKVDSIMLKTKLHPEDESGSGENKEDSSFKDMTLFDWINRTFYIVGKIKLYLNLMQELQENEQKLETKLLERLENLSDDESLPENIQAFLNRTDSYLSNVCELTKLFTDWIETSKCFFHWMKCQILDKITEGTEDLPTEEQMKEFEALTRKWVDSSTTDSENVATEEEEGAVGYSPVEKDATVVGTESCVTATVTEDNKPFISETEEVEDLDSILQENKLLTDKLNVVLNRMKEAFKLKSWLVVEDD